MELSMDIEYSLKTLTIFVQLLNCSVSFAACYFFCKTILLLQTFYCFAYPVIVVAACYALSTDFGVIVLVFNHLNS